MREMKWVKALYCLFSCLIIIVVAAKAIGATDDEWKKKNDRGNRYEGTIEIPVGAKDLELLSFVGALEPYKKDDILKVRFFLSEKTDVSMVALELENQEYYRMESKPWPLTAGSWNEFKPWPAGEVLTKLGVPSSNLGILITLKRSGGNLVAPAFLFHSSLPVSAEKYTLHFLTQVTLKKVRYDLYEIDNKEKKLISYVFPDEKIAGSPFPIELDMKNIPEGWMRLVLEGEYKNRTGKLIREYSFYHQPQIR